jgi:hypothetical protein
MSSDGESLSSGSLTLPFVRSDFSRLRDIETITLQQRQAATPASAASSVSVSAGESAAVESVTSEEETASFAAKIDQLSSLINEGAGGESEWTELVQADDYALYQALLLIMVRTCNTQSAITLLH